MNSTAPLLIGYDGSGAARRAVRETAKLFGSRRVLVATVWEPAPVLDVEGAQEIDDEYRTRAERIAEDGVELAKSLGLQAEALAVASKGVNVADTIVELAGERDVAAIVVGSRGLTGLRARLEGSTSSAVLKHSSCPVLIVHED